MDCKCDELILGQKDADSRALTLYFSAFSFLIIYFSQKKYMEILQVKVKAKKETGYTCLRCEEFRNNKEEKETGRNQ